MYLASGTRDKAITNKLNYSYQNRKRKKQEETLTNEFTEIIIEDLFGVI